MEEEKKVEAVQTEQTQSPQNTSEEIKKDPEVKPQTTITSNSTPKKIDNKTWIFIGIAVILLIAIILVLTIKPSSNTSATIDKYNYSYSVYSQNSLITAGSISVEKGKSAEAIGLASNKLDEEISSMLPGEEKNITLEAKDAYGTYNPELNFTYPRIEKQVRTNDINRTAWITISEFTSAFKEQPQLNQKYNISGAPWQYKVIDLNSTHTKVSQEASVGIEIPFGDFYYEVVEVTSNKIKLKLSGNDSVITADDGTYIINFTATEVITTYIPPVGSKITLKGYPEALVLGMNATDAFLDANDPNAGKTVIVTIKLNEIKKEASSGNSGGKNNGPTLQFYIMSHCPFGTQMAKGVIPVWEKFKDKANIELRFVSYVMHGAQETLDNNRLLCIREEQNSKLIEYLKCFVYGDGSEAGSQSCISSTGIDKTKLESCLSSRVDGYMDIDKELNTKYGVQGSPTVILNGEEADAGTFCEKDNKALSSVNLNACDNQCRSSADYATCKQNCIKECENAGGKAIWYRSPESVKVLLCNAFTSKPSLCSEAYSGITPSSGFGGGSSSSGTGGSCS